MHKKWTHYLIFLLCFLLQVLPFIRNGLVNEIGVSFWKPIDHDGIWHLTLINHLSNPFSIELPIHFGFKLTNYHFFLDYFLSAISNFFYINPSILLFQIFPVISTYIFLKTSYVLGNKVSQKRGGILLVIFNSVLSSFGIFANLVIFGKTGGESLFWSMQSASLQTNPPLVLSFIFINLLLIFLFNKRSPTTKEYLTVTVIIILLPLTKIYSLVLGYFIFFQIITKHFKTTKYSLLKFFVPILLSVSIYFLFNRGSQSLIKLMPFWFVRSLFYSPDRLYIPFIADFLTKKSLLLQLPLLTIGAIIFLVGNISWRILGFIHFLKHWKQLNSYTSLFFAATLCFFIPLFFVQEGTFWNTIQFFYYGLLVGNIFLVLYFQDYIIDMSKFRVLLLVVAFSIFANTEVYRNIYTHPDAIIYSSEYQALKFLSYLPQGRVLTYPYDPYIKDKNEIKPLSKSSTTSYVSAYSKQYSYLEDEMNLLNLGFNISKSKNEVIKFFQQKAPFEDRGFLTNNRIDYIYLTKEQLKTSPLDIQNLSLDLLFENPETVIYKVRR